MLHLSFLKCDNVCLLGNMKCGNIYHVIKLTCYMQIIEVIIYTQKKNIHEVNNDTRSYINLCLFMKTFC